MKDDFIFLLDDEEDVEILDIINNIANNNIICDSDKLISYRKIYSYAIILYFNDFFAIKYFNKIFIFENSPECISISNQVPSKLDLKEVIDNYSIGLILDGKKISNNDFLNLKKCYMLTKLIYYTKDNEICCKYTPYYLIYLELIGNTLTITMPAINSYCELNMDNVTTDLKTFLKKLFLDMDESNLKIHHEILKYYSTLRE